MYSGTGEVWSAALRWQETTKRVYWMDWIIFDYILPDIFIFTLDNFQISN